MAVEFLAGGGGWIVLILFIMFAGAGGVVSYVVLSRLRWPFKVILLENVGGTGYQPSARDRARMIAFGDAGEEIFFLKKAKKYRVAYGRRIGKKYIAWAKAQDGFWYNITFGDFDKKLSELGIMPTERNVRLANVSLRKGIENRYNQKNFFEKWGVPITIGMLIIAIIIQASALWFILDKVKDTAVAQGGAMEAAKQVMELAQKVLANVDSLRGGSGIS